MRAYGTIAKLNLKKQFGFIRTIYGEIFFHFTECLQEVSDDCIGRECEFKIKEVLHRGENKPRAYDVKLVLRKAG